MYTEVALLWFLGISVHGAVPVSVTVEDGWTLSPGGARERWVGTYLSGVQANVLDALFPEVCGAHMQDLHSGTLQQCLSHLHGSVQVSKDTLSHTSLFDSSCLRRLNLTGTYWADRVWPVPCGGLVCVARNRLPKRPHQPLLLPSMTVLDLSHGSIFDAGIATLRPLRGHPMGHRTHLLSGNATGGGTSAWGMRRPAMVALVNVSYSAVLGGLLVHDF